MQLAENGKVLKLSMRRNFISGDKKRNWHLGTTRPWTVGVVDKHYDDKIWSKSLNLVLDSCFPINRPYSKVNANDVWTSKYRFNAQMLYTSKVKASGIYTVETNTKNGESKLSVEIKIKAPS
jgi:hypothetical protein